MNAIQNVSSVLVDGNLYPSLVAAAGEVDVGVLHDGKAFWLGWVGVDSTSEASEIIASPPFETLNQLESFCREHEARYKDAGSYVEQQRSYPTKWFWQH